MSTRKNPWRELLTRLDAFPQKMLLAGALHGRTSDSGAECACFFGAVLPPSMPFSISHAARVRREPWYLTWLRELGFDNVPEPTAVGMVDGRLQVAPEGTYVADKTYMPKSFERTFDELKHLEYLNDSMTGPKGPGKNDETSCRDRYNFLHTFLGRAAALWDEEHKETPDVP